MTGLPIWDAAAHALTHHQPAQEGPAMPASLPDALTAEIRTVLDDAASEIRGIVHHWLSDPRNLVEALADVVGGPPAPAPALEPLPAEPDGAA